MGNKNTTALKPYVNKRLKTQTNHVEMAYEVTVENVGDSGHRSQEPLTKSRAKRQRSVKKSNKTSSRKPSSRNNKIKKNPAKSQRSIKTSSKKPSKRNNKINQNQAMSQESVKKPIMTYSRKPSLRNSKIEERKSNQNTEGINNEIMNIQTSNIDERANISNAVNNEITISKPSSMNNDDKELGNTNETSKNIQLNKERLLNAILKHQNLAENCENDATTATENVTEEAGDIMTEKLTENENLSQNNDNNADIDAIVQEKLSETLDVLQNNQRSPDKTKNIQDSKRDKGDKEFENNRTDCVQLDANKDSKRELKSKIQDLPIEINSDSKKEFLNDAQNLKEDMTEQESDETATNLDHSEITTMNLNEEETIDQNNENSERNIESTSVESNQNIQEHQYKEKVEETIDKPKDSEMAANNAQQNFNNVNMKDLNNTHLSQAFEEQEDQEVSMQDEVTEDEDYVLEGEETEGEPAFEHFGRIVSVESKSIWEHNTLDGQDQNSQMTYDTDDLNPSQSQENDEEEQNELETDEILEENLVNINEDSILERNNLKDLIQEENESLDDTKDQKIRKKSRKTKKKLIKKKQNNKKEEIEHSHLTHNLQDKPKINKEQKTDVDTGVSQNLLVERPNMQTEARQVVNEEIREGPMPKRRKVYVWQPQKDYSPNCKKKKVVLPQKRNKIKMNPEVKTGADSFISADLTICHICNLAFGITGFALHLKKHTEIKYKCSLCLETFADNEELKKHKKVHDETISEYHCEFCFQIMYTFLDFRRHLIGHYKYPHVCEECGVELKFKSGFLNHSLIHFELNFQCSICKKVTQNEYSLKSHMRGHILKNCAECGDSVMADRYQDHMLVHAGVKLIQCIYCGTGFFKPRTRNRHQVLCGKQHIT